MEENNPIDIPTQLVGTQADQLAKAVLCTLAGFVLSRKICDVYNTLVVNKRG